MVELEEDQKLMYQYDNNCFRRVEIEKETDNDVSIPV